MEQISSSLPTCSDSYSYRGKIKSLQDSADTTAGHVKLMLADIQVICSRKADGSADDVKQQAGKLQQVGLGVFHSNAVCVSCCSVSPGCDLLTFVMCAEGILMA